MEGLEKGMDGWIMLIYGQMDVCKYGYVQKCSYMHAMYERTCTYGYMEWDIQWDMDGYGDSFSQSRTSTLYLFTWMTINVLAYNPLPVMMEMETENW